MPRLPSLQYVPVRRVLILAGRSRQPVLRLSSNGTVRLAGLHTYSFVVAAVCSWCAACN
jgi:hypothetical protein